MKYSIKDNKKSSKKLTIQFNEEDLLKAKKITLKYLKNSLKKDGFRKGQMPDNLILKEVGEEAFKAQLKMNALELFYSQIIKEEKLLPVFEPRVKELSEDPLIFELEVDVYPEIKLGNIDSINVKKQEAKLEKKEIDETLKNFKKQHAEYKPVKRAAKKNDKVEIDFEGFNEDKSPLEGGKSLNHPLVIGLDTFIPGFEDNLIGLKEGDEKTFDISFPKDYFKKELQSKKINFNVKMKRVEEAIEVKIDDDFAKKITNDQAKTVKELNDLIEKSLLEEKNNQIDKIYQDKVLEKFYKLIDAEIPISITDNESQHIYKNFIDKLTSQNLTLEKYLEMQKIKKEDFVKKLKEDAERRVKLNMGLKELMKVKKIELNDKDQKTLLKNIDKSQEKEQILSEALFNKTLDYLYKLANKDV